VDKEEVVSNADIRIFSVKNLAFFKVICCVRTEKGEEGLSQRGDYADGGIKFLYFSVDVFYGRPLSTVLLFHP